MASKTAMHAESIYPADAPVRLLHYGREPLSGFREVEKQSLGMKPDGLWVSVEGENDWKSWCESESFRTDNLRTSTQVILAPSARLLHLSCSLDIDLFGRQFKREVFPALAIYQDIDWPAVAALYQGIIIAPYVWSRRLDSSSFWYYGWDCASGCIWDGAAIAEMRVVSDGDVARSGNEVKG